MIIIIIILARNINHGHVSARSGQGAGKSGRGSRPHSGHWIVGMLDILLSQCPFHTSMLNIHMFTVRLSRVGLLSSRQVPAFLTKLTKRVMINDDFFLELYANKASQV